MPNPKKNGLLTAMLSALAAMFGVQSERKRQEDFSSGSPLLYLLTGVLMMALFIGGVILLVHWALILAGV
jgi:cytochrome b subunit of formate dehydrogenase